MNRIASTLALLLALMTPAFAAQATLVMPGAARPKSGP